MKNKLSATVNKATDITKDKAKAAATVSKNALAKSKNTVLLAIDENGDGQIDIEDVIYKGLSMPGIKINREEFLKREFFKHFPEEVIHDAIMHNPAHAQIPKEKIDSIANEVIHFERTCVSGLSAALGMPGGTAMVATIPADIVQYYAYMLRASQKLMYLYGFPQIVSDEGNSEIDSETMNTLILCFGVMYGVAGANNGLKAVAQALAKGVEKKLLNAALTKGTVYPVVKSVAKWFGINMTKQVFAGFFKKVIPVVGGVVGGGITYITFKPCCDRLKKTLEDTMLSNPDHICSKEEELI